MTSESKLATDSCYIDNRLDGGVTDEANAYNSQINQFNNSKSDKIVSKKRNKFLLVSMAVSNIVFSLYLLCFQLILFFLNI